MQQCRHYAASSWTKNQKVSCSSLLLVLQHLLFLIHAHLLLDHHSMEEGWDDNMNNVLEVFSRTGGGFGTLMRYCVGCVLLD